MSHYPAAIPQLREEHWMPAAACRGLDANVFFPEQGSDASEAKAVCRGCPVTNDCLAYAIRNNEWAGVFGGMSVRERRILGRQLRAAGDVRLRDVQPPLRSPAAAPSPNIHHQNRRTT